MRAILFPAALVLASFGGLLAFGSSVCLACGDAPATPQQQEQYVPQPGPSSQPKPMVLASVGFGGGIVTAGLALSLLKRRTA